MTIQQGKHMPGPIKMRPSEVAIRLRTLCENLRKEGSDTKHIFLIDFDITKGRNGWMAGSLECDDVLAILLDAEIRGAFVAPKFKGLRDSIPDSIGRHDWEKILKVVDEMERLGGDCWDDYKRVSIERFAEAFNELARTNGTGNAARAEVWTNLLTLDVIGTLLKCEYKTRTIKSKLEKIGSTIKSIDKHTHQVRFDTMDKTMQDVFKKHIPR